jgi:hypothetical protein
VLKELRLIRAQAIQRLDDLGPQITRDNIARLRTFIKTKINEARSEEVTAIVRNSLPLTSNKTWNMLGEQPVVTGELLVKSMIDMIADRLGSSLATDAYSEWKMLRFAHADNEAIGVQRSVSFFKQKMLKEQEPFSYAYLDDLIKFCLQRAVVTKNVDNLLTEVSNSLVHFYDRCMSTRFDPGQLQEIRLEWYQSEVHQTASDRRQLHRILQLVDELEAQLTSISHG